MKTYEQFNQKPEIKRSFYKNGQKQNEEWILNNKRHREDGPAFQWWYENGQKQTEKWYLNNKIHREDGPAYQHWGLNGQKKSDFWCLNNILYSREEWIDKLKEINSPHYKEQKILYNAENYNI